MATTKRAKANLEFLLAKAEIKGVPEKGLLRSRNIGQVDFHIDIRELLVLSLGNRAIFGKYGSRRHQLDLFRMGRTYYGGEGKVRAPEGG